MQTTTLMAAAFALFAFTTIFFFARLTARLPTIGGSGFGWDDFTASATYAVLVALTVSVYYGSQAGLGEDLEVLQMAQAASAMKWQFISEVLYYPVVFGAKIGIVLLYLRTLNLSQKSWLRCSCRATTVVLVVTTMVGIFTTIFACSPVSRSWQASEDPWLGCSIDRLAVAYAIGSINILFDLVVALLPLPRLLQLHMALRHKVGLVAIYSLGVFVTAAGIVRLTTLDAMGASNDQTWSFSHLDIWALAECNCSLICCCLAAFSRTAQRSGRHTSFLGARLSEGRAMSETDMSDREAPFPIIATLPSAHKTPNWRDVGSPRIRSPRWDKELGYVRDEEEIPERGVSPVISPKEHHMQAMVNPEVKFNFQHVRRTTCTTPQTPLPPDQKQDPQRETGAMYYFDGQQYVGLEVNAKTPPTGPVTPIMFNVDENNVHTNLRSTSNLALDRVPRCMVNEVPGPQRLRVPDPAD